MRNDYLLANHAALDQDIAVQLCCLEIRYFFKDMPQIALDKKSNLEYLEREVKVSSGAINLVHDNSDLMVIQLHSFSRVWRARTKRAK